MMESLVFPAAELATVAVLTEGFVQILKGVITKPLSEQGKQLVSMVISIMFCVLLQVSIFKDMSNLGIVLGSVLAGIISSRGSNFIHDLINGVSAITQKK